MAHHGIFIRRATFTPWVAFALVLLGGASGVAQTPQDTPTPATQEKKAPAQEQDTKPVEKSPEPSASPETPAKEASKPTPTFVKPQPPRQRAWAILGEGLADSNAEKRANAVKALGLLARTWKQRLRRYKP